MEINAELDRNKKSNGNLNIEVEKLRAEVKENQGLIREMN